MRLALRQAPQLLGAEEEPTGDLGQERGVLGAEEGGLEIAQREGEVGRLFFWGQGFVRWGEGCV